MRAIRYLGLGALVSVGLALAGLGHPSPLSDHTLFEWLTGIALVVAVFGSGLAVERRVSAASWRLIGILLAVVMPASIALVAVFGAGAMGLAIGPAVLLGAVLAPTDPVLAGDVGLPGPTEPVVGEPRLSLHTEAGANDGLASPFVVAGLAIATQGGTGWLGHWFGVELVYRAGIAVVLGALAGRLAVAALGHVDRRRASSWELPTLALALAFAVYGACELVHGYGLVAVFLAGITFRRGEPDERFHGRVHHGTELAGGLLELVVLGLLGAALTTAGLAVPGLAGWLLAPLLILVIRPLLVLVASLGSPLRGAERRFLGAFGVRGVAAVYYAVTLPGRHVLSAHDTRVVVWTTIACVVVSIVVHGVGAAPLTRRWLGEPGG